MLLTVGNVARNKKGRKGGKIAKDRLTIGMIWNATGTGYRNLVFIGKATKKPRCFGKHWIPEKVGAIYYFNDKAWMRGSIWPNILINMFNSYCYYDMSNGDTTPVILLGDDAMWKCNGLEMCRHTRLRDE